MDIWAFWLIAYVITNALLAIPVAYVASSKGRSATGFFFLSFFFSFIVGILVVLALPKVERNRLLLSTSGSFAKDQGEDLFKCPNCAEWVKAEAKVCRFCGRDIAEQITQIALWEKQQDAERLRIEQEAVRANQELLLRQKAERKEKLKTRAKQPTFIMSMIGVFLVSAGVVGFILMTVSQKIIEQKSDWSGLLVSSCNSEMNATDSFEVNETNTRIDIGTSTLHGNEWLACIGETIAVGAPGAFLGQGNSQNDLGTYISDNDGGKWSGGGLGAVTVKYGNLDVVANRLSSDRYYLVISTGK